MSSLKHRPFAPVVVLVERLIFFAMPELSSGLNLFRFYRGLTAVPAARTWRILQPSSTAAAHHSNQCQNRSDHSHGAQPGGDSQSHQHNPDYRQRTLYSHISEEGFHV
jgi:hypothetical protein